MCLVFTTKNDYDGNNTNKFLMDCILIHSGIKFLMIVTLSRHNIINSLTNYFFNINIMYYY